MVAAKENGWNRSSSGNPCPVCGKMDSKCSTSLMLGKCFCHYSDSFNGANAYGRGDEPFPHWRHQISDNRFQSKKDIQPGYQKPLTARPLAKDIIVSKVYARFLALSPVDNANREDCQKRGIDPDSLGYGSLPTVTYRWDILAALTKEFGLGLATVPGFVEAPKGRVDFSHKGFPYPALLVPCRNRLGKIVAIKVRSPIPNAKENRWVCLSKGKHFDESPGGSSGSPCHWSRLPETGELVLITEGERKADTIAAHLQGFGVVSVPGAGNWKSTTLLDDLDQLGVSVVRLAFDADMWEKDSVAKGLLGLFDTLESKGIGVEIAIWDKAQKGLDDALMAGVSVIVRKTDEAQVVREELAKKHGIKLNKPHDKRGNIEEKISVSINSDPDILIRKAMEGACSDPWVFWRNGKLVQIAHVMPGYSVGGKSCPGKIRLAPIDAVGLAGILDYRVSWIKESAKGFSIVSTPRELAARTLAQFRRDDGIRPRSIFGIVNGPTLDLKGNLINQDGFHQIAGLGWFQWGAVKGLESRILDYGKDPREFAFSQVQELRNVGFPYLEFATDEDWAKFLTLIFTLILRPNIEKIPFFLVSGNGPGTGKGALLAAAHRIACGTMMPSQLWPERSDNRDEVLAREIINAAEGGASIFYFDDLPGGTNLTSKALDAAIGGQGEGLSQREFHQNTGNTAGGPARMVFIGAGNNVAPNDDLGRRTILIRIKSQSESPATRDPKKDFKGQGDLGEWFDLDENREKCLGFAINALRTYLVYLKNGGEEMKGKSLGGFPTFSRFVSGAVFFATGDDPLRGMTEQIQNTDSNTSIAALVSMLEEEGILEEKEKRISARILKKITEVEDKEKAEEIISLFETIRRTSKKIDARMVGYVLSRLEDTSIFIGNYKYEIKNEKARVNSKMFWLVKSERITTEAS